MKPVFRGFWGIETVSILLSLTEGTSLSKLGLSVEIAGFKLLRNTGRGLSGDAPSIAERSR